MRWAPLVGWGAVAFAAAGLFLLLLGLNLTALKQPGRTGESLRVAFTREVIRRRAAREDIPLPPSDRGTSTTIAAGRALYRADCAICHGPGGGDPTAAGRDMLPQALPLGSPAVQSFSDRQLFSIIKEGIRFTGMPAYGKSESDEQIWDLVDFLRLLR